MRMPLLYVAFTVALLTIALPAGRAHAEQKEVPAHDLFATSDNCVACHTGLVTPAGRDVSIATEWSATMMANSARDPYWQAAVRREVMDHPQAAAEIQDECSACHMPMARYAAKAEGGAGEVFAHLPFRHLAGPLHALAEDGVSCAMCHQILSEGLGTPSSFTGGFLVDESAAPGQRRVFGPYSIDEGRKTVMRSAARFEPIQAPHVQSSELCASCHTLYTHTRGAGGKVIATLPEQMPYLEWQHSAFDGEQSCQSCHMPTVQPDMSISSVLGTPREAFSRHRFRGGNFFMMRMLNRFRDELSVEASPAALDSAAQDTVDHLQDAAARVRIGAVRFDGGRLIVPVLVSNRAGHKLPSAYPSRRAWLHVTVTDGAGQVVFESGRFRPDGAIAGNDNDAHPERFEPHYEVIDAPEQVQIYEGILADPQGEVTTGLLTASRYVKDNRLLPEGFDKTTAPEDIAVRGRAFTDEDFSASGDRVVYALEAQPAGGPFQVTAALWYQPIAYRWAENLAPYDAMETRRFVRFFRSMAEGSAIVLARDQAIVRESAPSLPD